MGSKTKPVNEKFRVLTALGMIFVICGHYGIEASVYYWNGNKCFDSVFLSSGHKRGNVQVK